MEDHLRLVLLIDGVAQVKTQSISVNGQSGSQAVETLQGLAGKTPGNRRLEVSFTGAVALNGLEFDAISAGAEGTYHDLQIPVGAKSIISRGWFDTFTVSQSTGASTEVSATFIGDYNPPE